MLLDEIHIFKIFMEKKMSTQSSILALEIPWTEEPGRMFKKTIDTKYPWGYGGIGILIYCWHNYFWKQFVKKLNLNLK